MAATLDEAWRVMVEGPSGILALAQEGEVVEWSFGRQTIRFASGAEATLFSGAHPEGLQGPEHDFAWCDELAKWQRGAETWSNPQMGLRRGSRPQARVTTPRRVAALRGVLGEEGVVVTGGRSRDNPHVPDAWLGAMERMHGSSLHGRQELGGELIEDVQGALWPRALIERCRVGAHPIGAGVSPSPVRTSRSVVVGVDPPAGVGGDACGIVACGADARHRVRDRRPFGRGAVVGRALRGAGEVPAARSRGRDGVGDDCADAGGGGAGDPLTLHLGGFLDFAGRLRCRGGVLGGSIAWPGMPDTVPATNEGHHHETR